MMSLRCLSATLFVAAVTNLYVSCTPQSGNLSGPDAGNWTVGDCILAQFSMEFTVHYNSTAQNQTMTVEVPTSASVDETKSICGPAQQTLTLLWSDAAFNDSTVILNRTLTVEFSVVPNDTYYGVSRFHGVFDMAAWKEVNEQNETLFHTSQVSLDSGEDAKLMFHTPLDRSYLCADLGHIELPTTLNYLEGPPSGTKLNNTEVVAKNVKFDAFRTKDRAPPGYRTPMDCDYRPNDIVPIAVGVALALLVVTVLISYLVGRRRHRQRGYQSV